jgi:hypothetical protein
MNVNMRYATIGALALLALTGCRDAPAPVVGATVPAVPADKFPVAIPAHWHVALATDTGKIKLVAYVPEGQSREHWTDMLSVIVYDRSLYNDLNDVANGLGATYHNICAIPAIVAPPDMTTDNGSPASLQIARCGKGREGQAHIVVQKAIAGSDAIYVVKRAWTLPPVADSNDVGVPEAEMKAATAELDEVHLCDTAQHAAACLSAGEVRPATGSASN